MIFLLYLLLAGMLTLFRRANIPVPRRAAPLHPRWIWMIFVVIVLFGVLRNIPAAPFSALAPPK